MSPGTDSTSTPDSTGGADAGAARGTAPVQASNADLPGGTATGARRATDQAAAEVVGARRPLDLGQGGPVAASAPAATVGSVAGGDPTLLGVPGIGTPLTAAFDRHHPPDAALVADCVHCGFCLPTCPTYVLWGQEMDSPRGRIDLMRQGLEGDVFESSAIRHLDQCLGCMACVTACPSGVQYDKLIEATRSQLERRAERSRRERVLRGTVYRLFPYPNRLRALRWPLRVYQTSGLGQALRRYGLLDRLPAEVRAMESLAPKLGRVEKLPERTPAQGTRRRTVGLLTGCVQGAFFPDVNAATVRVLSAEGCEVVVPPNQGCCGALSAHGGREEEAIAFAKSVIATFEAAGVETVVVNAAGCGSNLKEYGHQLRDETGWTERAEQVASKAQDITELLDQLGPIAERHPLPMRVAYQDACHLAHAQGVREQPRALLRDVPGIELTEVVEAEICCGSAGTYNLFHPEPARELGERKARAVLATGADIMVTANPGCWMQVTSTLARMGERIPVAHTIQVLDASMRGTPVRQLLTSALDGPGTAMTYSAAPGT